MNEKTEKYMWGLQLYYKGTPTHVFSCEICKIFKNTYFEEHRWMAASDFKKMIFKEKVTAKALNAKKIMEGKINENEVCGILERNLGITQHGMTK